MEERINSPLTKRELVAATGCPPYLIAYYTDCKYLPLIKKSSGPGNPNVYHRDAIDIVKKRMAERRVEG